MSDEEIEVPLDVRDFMPHWAEETWMGDLRGAQRQYRYGNLHIRRYADRFTVHNDSADPRRDMPGHLLRDAPAALAALASAAAAGYASYRAASWLGARGARS